MKVGVKVGPEDWQETFFTTKAQYSEIWFRLDWQEKYQPLFKYLKKNKVKFGLHFWAQLKGKYFPNLLYLKDKLAEQTYRLIRETITIASNVGADYVNFHPESYRLNLLDLDKFRIKTLNLKEPIDREKSFQQLLFYLQKIKSFSQKKGVTALVETVPRFALADFNNIDKGRLKVQRSEGLETEKFLRLKDKGYLICLDIGHVIGQCLTENRRKLFDYLFETTERLLPAIGLIHITTNRPPFNGTDSHNGVLEEDFKNGVLPNRIQLIRLLSLFKNKDVWLIPEPRQGEMIENFFAIQKIVQEVIK